MSLLRNNVDNSINFQRASSTLDGCVKIWISRVDSVGTETGKLLSNLASDGRGAEDEEPTSDNPDAQETSQKRRKGTHRSESTLAKNAAQLKSKKLDLEFSVDPLFRKTCEDFDEGGAHGLLMNHLSLGVGSEGALRVIFDASDPMGKVGEDEDLLEPEDDVDLTALRRKIVSSSREQSSLCLPQVTSFRTWRFLSGRPFPIRWKASRFLATLGLLTKLHFSVRIPRLFRTTEVMKLMASDLDRLATLSILVMVPSQKRTSLWVTTRSETTLVGMTWVPEGLVARTMRMAQSMRRLALAQLAQTAVDTLLSILAVPRMSAL
jgi:hypothetical protein